MSNLHSAEEQFYGRYDWCLNPILSIRELLRRFQEELDGYQALDGWQREESKINLYLFACAITCTTDDYFGSRLPQLSLLSSRIPRLRFLFMAAEKVNLLGSLARIIWNWKAWRWRRRWNSCVAETCELLIADA